MLFRKVLAVNNFLSAKNVYFYSKLADYENKYRLNRQKKGTRKATNDSEQHKIGVFSIVRQKKGRKNLSYQGIL